MNNEIVLYVVIIIAVFSIAFFMVSNSNKSQIIEGVQVYSSGNPLTLGKSILNNSIILQEDLYSGNDSRNSAIAIASAQIAVAAKIFNHSTSAYGLVGNNTIGCNSNNSNCGYPQIIVQIGQCNCIKITSNQIIFNGNASFFESNAVNFGNVIATIYQSS
jgi:hypothetical protein